MAEETDKIKELRILGVLIPIQSRSSQLLFCALGLTLSFTAQNFLQEWIYRRPGFEFGAFMTSFEFLACSMGAMYERVIAGEKVWQRRASLREYLALTVLTTGSAVCGTSSLGFVNMPVKVVCKSSKLVPTMLVGKVINCEIYSWKDWASAMLLCLFVAIFSLADSHTSPRFSVTGIVLLVIAVVFDAMVPQCQQRLMEELSAPKAEVIFFSNLMGFVGILFSIIVSGELVSALSYCYNQQPWLLAWLVLFGVVMYCGVTFYITLVRHFGAVTTITVTTMRKVLTLCISFASFGHPYTWTHVASGVAVLWLGTYKVGRK